MGSLLNAVTEKGGLRSVALATPPQLPAESLANAAAYDAAVERVAAFSVHVQPELKSIDVTTDNVDLRTAVRVIGGKVTVTLTF